MTVVLTIPSEVEAELQERAASTGESVEAIASKILRDALRTSYHEIQPTHDIALEYVSPPPLHTIHGQGVAIGGKTIEPIPYDPVLDEE